MLPWLLQGFCLLHLLLLLLLLHRFVLLRFLRFLLAPTLSHLHLLPMLQVPLLLLLLLLLLLPPHLFLLLRLLLGCITAACALAAL
jgi:hypothetical protein